MMLHVQVYIADDCTVHVCYGANYSVLFSLTKMLMNARTRPVPTAPPVRIRLALYHASVRLATQAFTATQVPLLWLWMSVLSCLPTPRVRGSSCMWSL